MELRREEREQDREERKRLKVEEHREEVEKIRREKEEQERRDQREERSTLLEKEERMKRDILLFKLLGTDVKKDPKQIQVQAVAEYGDSEPFPIKLMVTTLEKLKGYT